MDRFERWPTWHDEPILGVMLTDDAHVLHLERAVEQWLRKSLPPRSAGLQRERRVDREVCGSSSPSVSTTRSSNESSKLLAAHRIE